MYFLIILYIILYLYNIIYFEKCKPQILKKSQNLCDKVLASRLYGKFSKLNNTSVFFPVELRLFLSQPLTLKQADRTSWKEPAIPHRQPGSPCAASRLRLLSPSERGRMQSVACCLVTMSCLNLWTPWTVALPGPWAFPGKTTGRLPFPSPGIGREPS